jgi:hypothetical protein
LEEKNRLALLVRGWLQHIHSKALRKRPNPILGTARRIAEHHGGFLSILRR